MILISHRGNLDGPNPEKENHPDYIKEALDAGYDVEVDVWFLKKRGFFLGHDTAEYPITVDFLKQNSEKLWIHCKNVTAMVMLSHHPELNYFWHQEDTMTLTSKQKMWVYPGKQPVLNSIAVMPEIHGDDLSICAGICSDYIKQYKK